MVKLFKDAPGIFYDDVGFGENVNQGFCLAYKFSFVLWDFFRKVLRNTYDVINQVQSTLGSRKHSKIDFKTKKY